MKFATTTIVLSSLVSSAFSAAPTCPPLSDPSADIWQSDWANINNIGAQAQALLKKVHIDENLSKCLASSQIALIDLINVVADTNCKKGISNILPNIKFDGSKPDLTLAPAYQSIFNDFSPISGIDQSNFFQRLQQVKSNVIKQKSDVSNVVCDNLNRDLLTCTEESILTLLFDKVIDLDDSENCCAPFKNDFKSYTGFDLTLLNFKNALRDIVNIPCSTATPGYSGLSSQTCIYSMIQSIFSDNDGTFINNLKASVSIKESADACNAANGNTFSTTTSPFSYKFTKAYGCCAASIDYLNKVLKTFPVVSKFFPNDAVAPGNCHVVANDPYVKKALELVPAQYKKFANDLINGLCVHFVIGFSDSCKYSNTCKSLPKLKA